MGRPEHHGTATHGDAPVSLRGRLYLLLESGADRRGVHLVDTALVLLIGLNIAAVMLASIPGIGERHAAAFERFEILSVLVFTLEYATRVWISIEHGGRFARPLLGRLRYALTPMALVDLLAIAPFWLGLFINLDLRLLRVLRLLRIFKLSRYSSAMNALIEVVSEEAGVIGAWLMILLVMLVLAAGGIYLFEHRAQPEAFGSMPAALWWAVATLTTVGYGDVTPITAGGKLFGGVVMVLGIGMVALPTGILASALSEHLRSRRESYGETVDRALADGRISAADRHRLEAMREELGLSREAARRILTRMVREALPGAQPNCPHCGKPLREPPVHHDD